MKLSKFRIIRITIMILILALLAFIFIKSYFFQISTYAKLKKTVGIKRARMIESYERKRSANHSSGSKFYIPSKYTDILKDVPCKNSYYINYYLVDYLNESDLNKNDSIRNMAESLAKSGYFDEAIKMANTIDTHHKAMALLGITKELAKTGNIDRAMSIAKEIDREWQKNEAFEHIVEVLAGQGEIDRALEISDLIEKQINEPKSRALRSISLELLKTGNIDEALTVANSMNDWYIKFQSLSEIAKKQFNLGQYRTAENLFKSLIDLIDSVEIDTSINKTYYEDIIKDKIKALNGIALELSKLGYGEWSEKIFAKALGTTDIMENRDKKDSFLRYAALGLLTAGNFERAMDIVNNMGPMYRFITLSDMSITLSKMDNDDLSEKIFNQALNVAEILKEDEEEIVPFLFVAKGLAMSEQFEKSLQVANKLKDRINMDTSYSWVTQGLAEKGQFEKAIQIAELINNEKVKADSLLDVLGEMTKQVNYTGFEDVFSRLLESINYFENDEERIRLFRSISHQLLNLPCEEQQKYIQKFVGAYDK
jgi:tetratricopeptide (TPR) repeat protein